MLGATGPVRVELRGSVPPNGALVRVRGEQVGEVLRGEARVENTGRCADWRTSDALHTQRKLNFLRLRHRAKRAAERFFDREGFLEVETPAMVPSPGLDLHLDAYGVADEDRWLITSPEYQMKRLLSATGPIVQFARCFRRGEVGSRHEPEFTMIEWYRPFSSAEEVMGDTERLVEYVAREVLGTTQLPSGVDVAAPWPRRSVRALFEDAGLEVPGDDERFFRTWVETIEPALGTAPVFVHQWPASMASLARLDPADPSTALRFEAYVGGMELCNGFDELVDAAEQRERLVADREARIARAMPAYPVDEAFLGALEEGLPPSGGNALGFERLVMLLAGADSIEDVVAIPESRLDRTPPK